MASATEETKSGCGTDERALAVVAAFTVMVREGLSEELAFRKDGSQLCEGQGKGALVEGNSMCKGPEAGRCQALVTGGAQGGRNRHQAQGGTLGRLVWGGFLSFLSPTVPAPKKVSSTIYGWANVGAH